MASNCKTSLLVILDCVDYTRGNCRVNEMVGAVLPKEVIEQARKACNDENTMSDNKESQLKQALERIKQLEAIAKGW